MPRYLMMHPSGYVYAWTEIQSKRKDMVEISEEEAQRRLPAQARGKPARTVGQELKVIAAEVPEVATGLKEKANALADNWGEGPASTEETPEALETEPEEEPTSADEKDIDPDIKMLEQIRVVGKGKAQVELYMLEKYGIDVDRRLKLDALVDQAIAARKKEIDNTTAEPPADSIA